MESKDLHVVFGSGPVACATAAHLLGLGARVRLVSRSGQPAVSGLTGDLEITRGDAADPQGALAAARGATHIYQCAHAPYDQWERVLPLLYGNLARVALTTGAVLAVPENLYMYARGVTPITEQTPVDPPSRKGRLVERMHQILVATGVREGLRWTAVRASDFYGPGATGQSVFGTERFLDPLHRGGRPMVLGDPVMPHTYTYVGDFGRALATAALSPAAHGQAWIVPNDRTETTAVVAELFRRETGAGLPPRAAPRMLLRLMGIAVPVVRELLEVLYQKEEPYVVDGSLFASAFGFRPTTLEEGVRRTVAWYRATRGELAVGAAAR